MNLKTATKLVIAVANPRYNDYIELSQSDAAKLYADQYWTARGYCLEYTTNKSVLFHLSSNRTINTDVIQDEFTAWAEANLIRVTTDNYAGYLGSLVARVRPRLHKVYGSAFRPVSDRFYVDTNGAPLANTFKPFNPPTPVDTEPPAILLELFDRICPVPEERKVVIEWAAAIIQRPLERSNWGLIFTGESACGKSSLVGVIKAALGGHHVNDTVTYTGLHEQFSTVLADYMLIALEDQPAPRDADMKLKQVMSVASKTFSIKNEQKQVRRDMFSRFIITSNERRPIRLDPTVRRWYAVQYIEYSVDKAESEAFFERFYAWMATPEAPAQIYHWLRSVQISEYSPHSCPRTATLDEMIGLSTSVMHGAIKDFVSDGHSFLDGQLQDYLKEELGGLPKRDIADLITTHLTSEGYKRDRRPITGWPKRQYVWTKKTGKRGLKLRPEDEAAMLEYLERTPY
jgi:hypothetical protein